MKKFFTFCVILFFAFRINAQVYTFSDTQANMFGSPGDAFNWNLTLSNPGASPITIYLERYQKTSPPYWQQCFCFIQCNPPSLDNLTINLAPGSSTIVSLLFKTDSVNPGMANASIRFYESAFPNNGDTVLVSAVTSVPTGVNVFTSPELFAGYPNPFRDKFTFIPSSGENYSLIITDIKGKIVSEYFNLSDKKYILSLENYPNGLYFIKAVYSSGRSETKKIIKN